MHPYLHAAYVQAVAPRPRPDAHHRAYAPVAFATLRRIASRHRAPARAASGAVAGGAGHVVPG
jgi:hypothetical protein